MKVIFCALALLMFFPVSGRDPRPQGFQALQQVTGQCEKEVFRTHGVSSAGCVGVYNNDEKLAGFAFLFEKRNTVTVSDARSLVISITESCVRRVNADKDIRNYLAHHPLLPTEFTVIVEFSKRRGKGRGQKLLGSVKLNEGTIFYYDHNKKMLMQETYKDALAKVGKQPKQGA